MSELIILNKKLKEETIKYQNQIEKFIQEKEEYINEKNLLKKLECLEKELNVVKKSNNEFEMKLINVNKIINNCNNDNLIDGNEDSENNFSNNNENNNNTDIDINYNDNNIDENIIHMKNINTNYNINTNDGNNNIIDNNKNTFHSIHYKKTHYARYHPFPIHYPSSYNLNHLFPKFNPVPRFFSEPYIPYVPFTVPRNFHNPNIFNLNRENTHNIRKMSNNNI